MTTKQPFDSAQGKQLKLGDAITKIAKALHIPHCEKCEQRRLILNKVKTLGMRETIKKLKAVGFSNTKNKADPLHQSDSETSESWSVEEIIKKMEDCCDESR